MAAKNFNKEILYDFLTSWEALSRGGGWECSVWFLNSEDSLLAVSQSAFSPCLSSFFRVNRHFLEGACLERLCM